MPATRVAMRKIKEVLRLHHACGLSKRKIAPLVGIGPTAVGDYLRRARGSGLGWPLPDGLDDEALERRLFPPPPSPIAETRPLPDWSIIARELRRKGVTLRLVWEEYRAEHPDGFGYSWFCDMYRDWQGRLSPTMRQEHRAGEKMFVDYAGQTMPIVTSTTGEVRDAQIFIAVLGASNFSFVTAQWSQSLPDWIGAHVDAFKAFGGVTAQVVCDNLKAGVTKASRYEPAINPTYREMAEHYGVAIMPTRPRKPRDKAKVEVGVQVVERWVLARLRNRTFFSLDELNHELRRLTADLNARVMRHLGASRRELFERLDRPALQPLPDTPYEYAEWRRARVGLDYHIEVDARFYSVPYRLLREPVDVRVAARTIEIFHKGRRVACPCKGCRCPRPCHRRRSHAEPASKLQGLDPQPCHQGSSTGRHPCQLVGRDHHALAPSSRAGLPILRRHSPGSPRPTAPVVSRTLASGRSRSVRIPTPASIRF